MTSSPPDARRKRQMQELNKELFLQDRESALSEKRDKLNNRAVIWSLVFGFAGAAGFVSAQSGQVSYFVIVIPHLLSRVAAKASHDEKGVNQLKGWLKDSNKALGYTGYEEYNDKNAHGRVSGGQNRALRDTILLIQLCAGFLAGYLFINNIWLLIAVSCISLHAMYKTVHYLNV